MQIKKSLAERFIDWYPHNTKLYIRGERSCKSYADTMKLLQELHGQLCEFFEQNGVDLYEDRKKK